jgi:hypothetical protein
MKRSEACRELIEVEGFHEVIVRPGVEAADAVGDGVLRRQDEDRGTIPALPGAPQDVETTSPWQPEIEQSTTS